MNTAVKEMKRYILATEADDAKRGILELIGQHYAESKV